MFFQAGPTNPTPDPNAGYGDVKDKQLDFVKSQEKLSEFSNQILGVFTQGRERIYELQNALAEATPKVSRLGGSIKDVAAIISNVAEVSGRNVVATTKQVEELYASSKLLGIETKTLVTNFLDVGMSISSVSDELEDSIDYVRSIGGNAKQVMQDVTKNMAQMNRFQFDDGVKGLTKMAAQASMLRFDMSKTFSFADKLSSPEVAIEAAAAFQRLGVAVGSLGDPLQLLNQSLNDPSGIQDSLIEISKQFTYFDDKTKSFKVSQEGILRFKELEQTTGISAAEMSKLGVAALEVDKRLSQISPSIKFENEEDKQYLANIARMGDGGEYEVEIRNEQGDEQIKKLSEVTQTELNKLIDEQKDGEKSIEELTRDQMTLQQIVANDVAAIRTAITGGVVTAPTLQALNEEIRNLTDEFMGSLTNDKDLQTSEIRKDAEAIFSDLEGDLAKIVMGGNFSPEKIFEELLAGSGTKLQDLSEKSLNKITDISTKIAERLKEDYSGGFGSNTTSSTEDKVSRTNTPVNTTNTSSTRLSVEGLQASSPNMGEVETQAKTQNLNVEFGGKIPDINVNFNNAPQGMTPQQIEEWKKIFKSVVNEQYFRNYLIKVYDPSGAEVPAY
jgi:hypothetical protein